MIEENEFGWGGVDTSSPALSVVSSAMLVVASGLYCGSVWLVSGLQPLPSLAARVPRRLRRFERSRGPQAGQ